MRRPVPVPACHIWSGPSTDSRWCDTSVSFSEPPPAGSLPACGRGPAHFEASPPHGSESRNDGFSDNVSGEAASPGVAREIRDRGGLGAKRTSSFFAENRREKRAGSRRDGAAGDRASPFSGAGSGKAGRRSTALIMAAMRVPVRAVRIPPFAAESGSRIDEWWRV